MFGFFPIYKTKEELKELDSKNIEYKILCELEDKNGNPLFVIDFGDLT